MLADKVSFTASAPDAVVVGDQFRLSYTDVYKRQPIIEEKEEITAEKIIEQELMKANLQPVAPIIPPAKKETIRCV